ncbi:extracellular solute-binding protein [Pseudomonas stutzeri]|nr:extracellular solute-binding protein [Stutzerimonas stutzeri]
MLKRTLLAASLCLGAGLAQAEELLRVYGWEGRLSPAVIEGFEKQSGIRVEYTTYTSAEDMLREVGAGSRYDVVFPSHFQLPALVADQRLQPLDPGRLPNLSQVDPDLLAMLSGFDGKRRHAVPYLWGTVGLALNVSQVVDTLGEMPEDSWGLMFDAQNSARLAACGIGLLDAREEALSLLLNYKGRALERSAPRAIRKAGEELGMLRERARSFDNGAYTQQLADGKLCMAMAWSGHVLKAADAGAPLRFVMPREGALMFIDTMAIPRSAQNVAGAHRFIDYLASAEANTRNSRDTLFYPVARPDAPAMTRLASERLELVLTGDQRRSFFFLEALSARTKSAVDDAWAQVKR